MYCAMHLFMPAHLFNKIKLKPKFLTLRPTMQSSLFVTVKQKYA